MLGELVLLSTKNALPQIVNSLKSPLVHNIPVLFELSKRQLQIYQGYKLYHTINKSYPEFRVDSLPKYQKNDQWIKKLNDDEKTAIHGYSYRDYEIINQFLRNKNVIEPQKTDHVKEAISLISSALAKSEIPEDIVVYRTTSNETFKNCYINNFKDLEGLVFLEKGYLSTSDESVGYTSSNNPIFIRIKVPKGTKAANISDLSYFEKESEVLIDKNQKLLITKVDEKNNKKYIDCEILSREIINSCGQEMLPHVTE